MKGSDLNLKFPSSMHDAIEGEQSLLIVEDNLADLTHYHRLLEDFEHPYKEIIHCKTVAEALAFLERSSSSTCLLDHFLPDGSALDFFDHWIDRTKPCPCPTVVITGLDDVQTAVKLMQNGAQDYLIKQSLDASQLQRALINAQRTWSLQTQLKSLALYDTLTGLVNRTLFLDRLTHVFDESKRYDRPFALLYIDLDHFKSVNDQYGHDAGDELLKQVGQRFNLSIRSCDTAARLGGDEFAVILPDTNEGKANHVAYKLVHALTFSFIYHNHMIEVSPSIGLASWPSKAREYKELMREADIALYRAKANGRGCYCSFNQNLEREAREEESRKRALPDAFLDNSLDLFWQPIFCAQTYKIAKVEALVRWRHKNKWVQPEKIIDLVQQCHLSEPFHVWLFNRSIKEYQVWAAEHPDLQFSINLPANLCHEPALLELLIKSLKDHQCRFDSLVVEVTEAHLTKDPEQTKRQLEQLAEMGIAIAIDDFGTGYNSLTYLASLPISILKIDKSFIMGFNSNAKNRKIVEATIALARHLDLKIIAEGVASHSTVAQAREMGCDFLQGFWLGAPTVAQHTMSEFLETSQQEGRKSV